MTTFRHTDVPIIAVCLFVSVVAQPALAGQEATVQIQNQQGGLSVERVKNGFIIAPDFKFTELDDDFANLAGGYAGWITDDTVLIGAGGYFLTNRSDDFKMAYGGLVLQWLTHVDRRIGFGARGLVGGGGATLSSSLSDLFGRSDDPNRSEPFARFGSRSRRLGGGLSDDDTRIIFNEGFFIVEPQVDLFLRLTERLRLDWGLGYRLIGGARGVEDRLRGVTGSIALQIGGGS